MPYKVFISYTRKNDNVYLERFVKDLTETLEQVSGGEKTEMVFFDQRDVEGGEEWDPAIVAALQTSDVLMPLLSPAYFSSTYCEKELILFRLRCEAHLGHGVRLPPVIKPIIWIPFKQASPAIAPFQYKYGPEAAPHNTIGVWMELRRYKAQYNRFIEHLAKSILDARPPEIPPLPNPPALAAVAVGQPIPVASIPVGPKHVRFVYVAADPRAIGNARNPDPYVEFGGPDWRPYFPTQKKALHPLLQNFVSSDDLNFSSDELRFSDNLVADILACLSQRQIVVILVDGWSLHSMPRYQTVLRPLDTRLDYHWGVLVPKENDPKIHAQTRANVAAALSGTFGNHARLLPMFYRDGLGSPDELTQALRVLLIYLKDEIRRRATVEVPVPAGPPKSTVHGPS